MKRSVCDICNERRFNMKLKIFKKQSMCDRCWRDGKKYFEKIVTYAQNNMNSQSISAHLFQLTVAEKLLIVRVHVMMNLRRVKNVSKIFWSCHQFYAKHCQSRYSFFMFINRNLNMILKSLFHDVKNNKIHHQFKENFRVRRDHVEIWLKYLIEHHFDYKILSLDVDKLLSLFVNNSIFNLLMKHEKLNESVDLDEKNQKISLNMLILRLQVKFSRNNVDVANLNKFVDDEKMSVIADFCVSNVINYIIEKLYLKRRINAKSISTLIKSHCLCRLWWINFWTNAIYLYTLTAWYFQFFSIMNLFRSIIREFASYLC